MTKKNTSNYNAHYHKLPKADDGFVDLQFKRPDARIPWKAILLALFLFVIGTGLLVFSSFLFTQHSNDKHTEGAWPILILGFLMFIPGLYHVRIAYFAYHKYPGFSFDDIPDFD